MRVGVPAGRGRLAGEAVARHRRDHDVEGVRRAAAVRRGIGQRIDDLQLLDDRAGPAVRDDERQRVLVLRADVDEVDVEPVDLGDELRQRVQLRLDLAPVVLGRPVARELLHRRELHALRRRRRRSPARASASRRCAGAGRRARSPGRSRWKGRMASLAAAAVDGGRGARGAPRDRSRGDCSTCPMVAVILVSRCALLELSSPHDAFGLLDATARDIYAVACRLKRPLWSAVPVLV